MEMIKLEHSFPLGTSHKHCRVFQTKATEWMTLGVVGYSEFIDGSKEVVNKGQWSGRAGKKTCKLGGCWCSMIQFVFCYCNQLKLKMTPV